MVPVLPNPTSASKVIEKWAKDAKNHIFEKCTQIPNVHILEQRVR